MESLTLKEILCVVDGKIIKKGTIEEFKNVSIDTRKIETDHIFIGIKGENFDGNKFIKEACEKGASLCIVNKLYESTEEFEKFTTTIIQVEDTKKALIELAAFYRSKLRVKVIGITGSTGKTSTKDLTAAALSGTYKVFKTKGNFNNEIGLPLMVFQLDNSYDVAVLEMGMSNFNEIHNLAYIARPDIALITNIGISHIENLKTRENILKAKLEITDFFTDNNTLIINADNDILENFTTEKYKLIKIGTKYKNNELNYCSSGIITNEDNVIFDVNEARYEEQTKFLIPLPGRHNVLNSLLAIATAKTLGMNYEAIKEGLNSLESTSMRLEITRGKKITIINDSYNASPDSMVAAIDVLEDIKCKRKIAVLGTMMELGEHAYEAHFSVGQYLKQKNIDLLLCLGEYNDAFTNGFNNKINSKAFQNKEEIINYIEKNHKEGDVFLVKASRSMKFEHIVKALESIMD